MYFCEAFRDIIRREHPELKHTQVLTELGKRWQIVSEAEKTQFHAKAKLDKARYKREIGDYSGDEGDDDDEFSDDYS